MSKVLLKALGDELISRGFERNRVRRALASVTAEEADEALSDALAWAEDVVESAEEPEELAA